MLPVEPFDGMIFIDQFQIKWIYNSSLNCWQHSGKVDNIPPADSQTTGLLTKDKKTMIDGIPPKGGGYAIITKPLLGKFRSTSNPDSVLFGFVDMKSDSLVISCVDAEGNVITRENCSTPPQFKETDTFPPGFSFDFSAPFIDSLCIEIPGGPGPRGLRGERGKTGSDGTGDGPQGDTGKPGTDAVTHWILSGVKIIETDEIFETAVVALDLKAGDGKLIVTKGKVKLPSDSDTPVEEFLASRIQRTIKWGKCFSYTLNATPCVASDPNSASFSEFLEEDPIIAFYPESFLPENKEITKYQPVRAKLSDLINDIITFYNTKLGEASEKWDKQIEDFIVTQDKAARAVLDDLANQLAACEQKNTMEFCLGINRDCCDQNIATVNDPAYTTILEELGYDPKTAKTTNLSLTEISASSSPVFSFDSLPAYGLPGDLSGGLVVDSSCTPSDGVGCWCQFKNGSLSFVPSGTFIPRDTIIYNGPWGCGILPPKIRLVTTPDAANPTQIAILADLQAQMDATGASPSEIIRLQQEINKILDGFPGVNTYSHYLQNWINAFSTNLENGYLAYNKTQILYTGGGPEFPIGTFAFSYISGAFSQAILNDANRWGYQPQDDVFIHGPFQKYWVGNEGGSTGRGPFFILNPYNRSIRMLYNSKMVTDEIGLEIGFAPIGYADQTPGDYFSTYAYNGNAQYQPFETPVKNVATTKMDAAVIAMENNITWYPFPTIGGAKDDPGHIEYAYGQKSLSEKSVVVTTTTPGYFFARVKLAYSATNFFGSLMMPPNDLYNTKEFTTNRVLVYEEGRFTAPTFVSEPVAIGSVKIQALRIEA
jgi:hypothetical protein